MRKNRVATYIAFYFLWSSLCTYGGIRPHPKVRITSLSSVNLESQVVVLREPQLAILYSRIIFPFFSYLALPLWRGLRSPNFPGLGLYSFYPWTSQTSSRTMCASNVRHYFSHSIKFKLNPKVNNTENILRCKCLSPRPIF